MDKGNSIHDKQMTQDGILKHHEARKDNEKISICITTVLFTSLEFSKHVLTRSKTRDAFSCADYCM